MATTTSTIRTTARVDVMGGGGATGWALIAWAFGALRRRPALQRPEDLARQPGHADQPRADVRADDRPDLGHELRVAAVDLAAAAGEPLGHLVRLDVLDEEHVGARVAPVLQEVDHALEG